jgi:hypothetical protein
VTGRWKRIDFHPLNQTVFNGETMPNVLIGNHGPSQVAHDLMHFDQDVPGILGVKGHRFDVRIDFAPLLSPVGADGFRPTDKTAFERSGPLYLGSHESKCGINIAGVESRVGGTEQFGFWCRLVWHKRKWFSRGKASKF